MKSTPSSPEGRQHINISQYAYDVIRNDSLNFLGTINLSGFINTIVESSMAESFDDLVLEEEERIKDELSSCFNLNASIKLSASEEATIQKIATAHRYHLIKTSQRYPKNQTLKIRLNNKLHNEFYPLDSEWEGYKHEITPGVYIKAILEEYSRKTYYERECIFFKNELETLSNNISAVDSNKRILEITMKDNRKALCKLYRLSEEYETHYHYLIGLFLYDDNSEYQVASIRLSRIANIKPRARSLGSGVISRIDKAKIESRIKESGIPYLLGVPIKFEIQLTPTGMILYDYKYSQRPVYNSKHPNQDGTYTLEITATERQIKNYFFAFGKEANIISPASIREWMFNKYSEATSTYER